MKLLDTTPSTFVLEFDKQELEFINNALNEVCNGIDLAEFETRMGCPRERLQEILSQISKALEM